MKTEEDIGGVFFEKVLLMLLSILLFIAIVSIDMEQKNNAFANKRAKQYRVIALVKLAKEAECIVYLVDEKEERIVCTATKFKLAKYVVPGSVIRTKLEHNKCRAPSINETMLYGYFDYIDGKVKIVKNRR